MGPPLLHGAAARARRAAAWFKRYGPPHHCVVGLHQRIRLLAVSVAVIACIASMVVSKVVSMYSKHQAW